MKRPTAAGRQARGFARARGGAALGAVLAIGLLMACSAAPTSPPHAPSVAPPTTSVAPGVPATPVPSAPPASPPSAGSWRSAPDQAAIAGVELEHVVWTGQRFVATGVALGGVGEFVDSRDGTTWQRQPDSGADAYPGALAAGPGGVVAIGRIGEQPASWFSRDGLTWTVRASAFASTTPGGNEVSVTALVATDAGWLAVGRTDPPCNHNCGLAPVRARAWTSPDGRAWTPVPDQASFARAGMTGVTRGGPGLVAVGLAGAHAAAWTSPDGLAWTRVPDSPLFHGLPSTDPAGWTEMTGVASGHGVVVAIGNDGPGGAHGPAGRAWWSADGSTWARADGQGFQTVSDSSVLPTAVVTTPAGFLTVAASHGTCTSGIWTSADGAGWQCDAADPSLAVMTAHAAAASSSIEVIVGLDSTGEPGDDGFPGLVWLRSVP